MSRRPENNARAGGFSLIEVILAMAIVSILLVGMGAALTLSAGAADLGKEGNARSVTGGRAIELVRSELTTATGLIERKPASLIFTVPDRDGDAEEEKIGYTWSGVSGDPVMRSFNGATPRVFVDSAANIEFSHLVQLAPKAETRTLQVLANYNANASGRASTVDVSTDAIMAQLWTAPVSVVSVQINEVSVALLRKRNGTVRVRLFLAGPGGPTSGTLAGAGEISVRPNTFATVAFGTIAVSPPVDLSGGASIWVVVDALSSTQPVVAIPVETNQPGQPSSGFLATSLDAGANWTFAVHSDTSLQLRGNVTRRLPGARVTE
ncbi:MAG: prepilin-type N-terminal cleavage/methylation domain-containing protein [Phycisphaerales bacterium]|nr:prepilin-type N-terminal cleavage/methylation domain-containing protein [Phycisphaerales bacterium]